ncbi:hypothetical protein B0H12DRAFT_1120921 [Mycena haematopus]|nr:hypothetical protein B0H12DRAFT_1120921 [Mycena haematopus]
MINDLMCLHSSHTASDFQSFWKAETIPKRVRGLSLTSRMSGKLPRTSQKHFLPAKKKEDSRERKSTHP